MFPPLIDPVVFFNQHKAAATGMRYQDRIKSGPASKMGRREKSPQAHWITWNSGTPEPPGRQKRLHKPWPSPEPVAFERRERFSYSPVSAMARPGSGPMIPVRPDAPMPDALGSEGFNPVLTRDREQCFTPKPPSLAVSDLRNRTYPIV